MARISTGRYQRLAVHESDNRIAVRVLAHLDAFTDAGLGMPSAIDLCPNQSSIIFQASIPWEVSAQAPGQCVFGLNVCFDYFRICSSKCIQSRHPVAPGIPLSSLSGLIAPLPLTEKTM